MIEQTNTKWSEMASRAWKELVQTNLALVDDPGLQIGSKRLQKGFKKLQKVLKSPKKFQEKSLNMW